MSKDKPSQEPGTEVAPISEDLVRRFADMAAMLPAEEGSGSERIIEAILSAGSWEELSDPWESSNGTKLTGKLLKIDVPTRRPSTYAGGLGIFLVVPYTDTANGDAGVFTTSSTSIVAQLVRAYALGAFPVYAEVVVADRPTDRGFLPQHLKISGSGAEQS